MKSIIRIAVVPAVVATLTVGGATAVQARPSPTGNVSVVARTHTGAPVTSARAVAEVAAFWTPERMAAAVDLDDGVAAAETGGTRRVPDGPAGSVAPVAPATGSPEVGTLVNESAAVGKVYVMTSAGPGQCSASTVGSGKRRLVMTAGHCVHGGQGSGWFWNFVFVPRFRQGSEPFGRFVAGNLTSRTAWVNNSNRDEDMGIAIMNNGGVWGAKVVDTVGGMGLRWNWGYGVSVTILGYPAAGGFPGDVQYYCQSGTWNGHGQQVRAWCNMTQGSSGGPWLMAYDDSSGLGYTNSVVSHRHSDPSQMDGPYFDNDIKSLYDFAEGLSPA